MSIAGGRLPERGQGVPLEAADGDGRHGDTVKTYIKDLGEVDRGDIAMAGGKAVGLGGLIRAGLPVPPGFVLTTAAYSEFVTGNNLAAAIRELGSLPPDATPEDYERASGQIRDLFGKGTMPPAINDELAAAYQRLGSGTSVSVRSSATAEDLASASFAGQQETYLNVRGQDALAKAVTDCWASLWTARAMAYRAREGVLPGQVRLAVVVQQMVEADAAGVMFTANPANGRRDQTAISAAWGGLAEPGAQAGVVIAGADRPVRAAAVEERRMLWRGQAKANAPQMLPESKWMERSFASWMPAGSQHQAGEVIKGAGASSGKVTAPARVLRGPGDFGRMQPGEVLVARITTPAWTPLFAMASAVVTDVGGPLSHSSIVAREYGILAVLGTGVATQRLSSGQRIGVDGDAGTVTIERP